jgi:hypothetical protein
MHALDVPDQAEAFAFMAAKLLAKCNESDPLVVRAWADYA